MAFVISDFYTRGFERALALASAKHDVIPVMLVDPRDESSRRGSRDVRGSGRRAKRSRRYGRQAGAPALRADHEAGAHRTRRRCFKKLALDECVVRTDKIVRRAAAAIFARRAKRMRSR